MLHHFKNLPQYLTPKRALTRFAGFMASHTNVRLKNFLIVRFVQKYSVNMDEALEENPLNYASFNDFFVRHLKKELRPLAQTALVSPVDGCISALGKIHAGQILQAKQHFYTVEELLAVDKQRSDCFKNGAFMTLYLSPKDYHRIHMPIEGTLEEMVYVPGKLFSVKPKSADTVPKLFAINERLVVFFNTPIGPMAMVLVGATIVGTIGTSWGGDILRSKKQFSKQYGQAEDPIHLQKGEEMGYFKLGSSVVLLFGEQCQVHWKAGLKSGDSIRLGEALVER